MHITSTHSWNSIDRQRGTRRRIAAAKEAVAGRHSLAVHSVLDPQQDITRALQPRATVTRHDLSGDVPHYFRFSHVDNSH